MRRLPLLRKSFALAAIIMAVAAPLHILFFATVSYQESTITRRHGQPSVISETSGEIPLRAQLEPASWAAVVGLALLLAAGGVAAWRKSPVGAGLLSVGALIATFATGFSIGGLYLPSTSLLCLSTLVLIIQRSLRRSDDSDT